MAHLHRIPFNFHGHGHALSGEFRHPLWSIIPAQASASLSSRSEEHTSELQSRLHLVCRLLLEKKKVIDVGVESSEVLVLMATGTRHGRRHEAQFEVCAEAFIAFTHSRYDQTRTKSCILPILL